jgi:hypothetical protein
MAVVRDLLAENDPQIKQALRQAAAELYGPSLTPPAPQETNSTAQNSLTAPSPPSAKPAPESPPPPPKPPGPIHLSRTPSRLRLLVPLSIQNPKSKIENHQGVGGGSRSTKTHHIPTPSTSDSCDNPPLFLNPSKRSRKGWRKRWRNHPTNLRTLNSEL